MRLIIRNENVMLAIDNPVSREVVQPVCGEESVGVYTPPLRLISFGPGNLAAHDTQLTERQDCYQLRQVRCLGNGSGLVYLVRKGRFAPLKINIRPR